MHHYGHYVGTKYGWYGGSIGKSHGCMVFDLYGGFERVRMFDFDTMNPNADPTTTGENWYRAGVGTGPSKGGYINHPPGSEPFYYWNGYGHFYNWNPTGVNSQGAPPECIGPFSTTIAEPIDMDRTIDRVHFMTQWVNEGSVQPDKWIQLVHNQPPVDQMGCMPFDTAFGTHSNGSNYLERVIFREIFSDASQATYDGGSLYYGVGSYMCRCDNNYPTSRTFVMGWQLIDEPGTVNDQFMYHGAGDPDPFIGSLIADMREGRNFVWLGLQPYNYYAGGWPLTSEEYLTYYAKDNGNHTLILDLGPPASTEDWVLYK
jgi:hypothetical protein